MEKAMKLSNRIWLDCLLLMCCCNSLVYSQGDPAATDSPDYADMEDNNIFITATSAPGSVIGNS